MAYEELKQDIDITWTIKTRIYVVHGELKQRHR
jgi:hypothetical protein